MLARYRPEVVDKRLDGHLPPEGQGDTVTLTVGLRRMLADFARCG
jgi:hypothetical protein